MADKVPYVTVYPFGGTFSVKGNWKKPEYVYDVYPVWCASKDFREQMFVTISTLLNKKGSW